MTREEQLREEGKELYSGSALETWVNGALWADEHPREMPTRLVDEAPIDPDIQQVINDIFFDML